MKIAVAILFIASTLSCKSTSTDTVGNETDEVIAEVGSSVLYKSKISDLYESDISEGERKMLIKGFVSNWIREQLMIQEAEKNIASDININSLVNDYRSSLILNYYENKMVSELLDTFVSDAQKQAYYDDAKNEFILSESIFKGIVFKTPISRKNSEFKKLLKLGDPTKIQEYLSDNAIKEYTNVNKWYSTGEVLSQLPSKLYTEKTIAQNGSHVQKDKEYEYFVKTIDYVGKNDVPPLEYIDSKITQIILNNRKKALIKRKKQQLYDQNYQNNRIKINI